MALKNIEMRRMTLNLIIKNLDILSKVSTPFSKNLLRPFKANFWRLPFFKNWKIQPFPLPPLRKPQLTLSTPLSVTYPASVK